MRNRAGLTCWGYSYKVRIDRALAILKARAVFSIAESDLQIIPILQESLISAPVCIPIIFNRLKTRVDDRIDFEAITARKELKLHGANWLSVFSKDNTNRLVFGLVRPNELMIPRPRLDVANSILWHGPKIFFKTSSRTSEPLTWLSETNRGFSNERMPVQHDPSKGQNGSKAS
jgi:hypothetical protein